MKRLLFTLVPWMVIVTAAFAQARSADVLFTHFDGVPQPAYRIGDECFVPIEALAGWGWEAELRGEFAEVRAEGKTFRVTARSIGGKRTIPLRRTLNEIGATGAWVPGTDTLEVRSPLTEITISEDRIRAAGALAMKPAVTVLDGPPRLVVDLHGASLTPDTKQNIAPNGRIIQFRPGVVRLIVEPGFLPERPSSALPAGRSFEFGIIRSAVLNDPTKPSEEGVPPTAPPQIPVQPGVLPLVVKSDTPTATVIAVETSGVVFRAPKYAKPEPTVLEITFPGLNMLLPEGFGLGTTSATASTRLSGQDTILTLTFPRAMGAELAPNSKGIVVTLFKPLVGNGKLAGKIVVVDAGHGGRDGGAKRGGFAEKNLNLGMAKYLSQYLSEAGATVILTRKTDVFVDLDVRADIANRAGADFFISCHTNSSGAGGKQRGVTTYYHGNSQVGRLLADCLQREMTKVSGIPNAGVKSDYRIYNSGFAVLRNTKMPGVLLEMGFIDNASDRKRIVTKEFQQATMKAAVQGLRVFLGDIQ